MSSSGAASPSDACSRATKRPADTGDGSAKEPRPSRWSQAEVSGGDERKQKFMRLMGSRKDNTKDSKGATTQPEPPQAEATSEVQTEDMSEYVPVDVHTANDWEHASLQGGDQRKVKFMRLMGATKAPVSTTSTREREDSDSIDKKLEQQYTKGMDLKLAGASRRHVGLGFAPEEPPRPDSSTGCDPNQSESKGHTESPASKDYNEADAKPNESAPQASEADKDQIKNVGFVKSSS